LSYTRSEKFLKNIIRLVGAWGFEPQISAVSKHRCTFQKSNNTAVSLGFSALPDQLPDQPAQLPAQITRVSVYVRDISGFFEGSSSNSLEILLVPKFSTLALNIGCYSQQTFPKTKLNPEIESSACWKRKRCPSVVFPKFFDKVFQSF
jgi:hypothetical protein